MSAASAKSAGIVSDLGNGLSKSVVGPGPVALVNCCSKLGRRLFPINEGVNNSCPLSPMRQVTRGGPLALTNFCFPEPVLGEKPIVKIFLSSKCENAIWR